MKITFKKSPFPPILFLLLTTVLLSACGFDGTILGGTGGNDPTTETEAAVSTQTTLATAEPATSTPIPGTFGHIIFVSNRDGQMNLYMTSPDGIEVTRLTTNASENVTPRISPDGTRVAFVSTVNNNMDIYVLEIATGHIIRVTDAPEKDSAPSWSSDGSRLAFESFRDGNFEIYVVNADGSSLMRLTNEQSADTQPIWSPVSDEIVFVTGRFGNSDLMRLDLNGAVSTLTTNPSPDYAPAWSPDGNSIAFQSFSGELSNLCLIGRDGLNQRCLTSTPDLYDAPVWSPDGLMLAVNAKQTEIQIFNIQTGEMTSHTSPGIEPRGTPVWSPEGLRLVFQAQVNGDFEIFSILLPTGEFSQITSIPGYDGEPAWTVR